MIRFRDTSEFLMRCKDEADKGKLEEFLPRVELKEVRGTTLDRALDWIRSQDWFEVWNNKPFEYKEEIMRRLVTGAHRDFIEIRRKDEEVYVSDHLFERS